MSVDKKRVCRLLKTAALALLIICIFALPCVIQARWVDTNAAYQKELAWKLGTMPLMYYECTLIDSDTEDKETRIHFMLNTHQPSDLIGAKLLAQCREDKPALALLHFQDRRKDAPMKIGEKVLCRKWELARGDRLSMLGIE